MSTQTTEITGNKAAPKIQNFRTDAEVEKFYRYVHENNLRVEAHKILQYLVDKIAPSKKSKRKSKAKGAKKSKAKKLQ